MRLEHGHAITLLGDDVLNPSTSTCMYAGDVRTTIELRPEHRAKLLEMAAHRGQKDLASVIQEAIEAYLEASAGKERLRDRALALRGALARGRAERLRRDSHALRGFWR